MAQVLASLDLALGHQADVPFRFFDGGIIPIEMAIKSVYGYYGSVYTMVYPCIPHFQIQLGIVGS